MIELTDREEALIRLMRSMRHGTLEKIGVKDGQPAVIVAGFQRIDLDNAGERDAVTSLPVDFGDPQQNAANARRREQGPATKAG